ncbi:Dabb family protein [Paenarthrobacter sp. S56]|uniref:Dabb family protein n=1 Tax=Paenarthrobacter sp. S56 TaxID=3138179 RepID=UPI00321BE368
MNEVLPQGVLGDAAITASGYRPGLIKHIVLFKYRDATTPAEREEIEERFHALQTSTRDGKEYILGIESGPQNSPEGLHRGLEHGFIVTFGSEGDRNYYLGEPLITNPGCYDPAPHGFKQFVGPYLSQDGVLVFDFPVQRG